MIKYYYGIWQNFYYLSWPLRFLIEIVILFFVLYLVWHMLRKLVNKLRVRSFLAKGCVWLVTEIAYLLGGNQGWVTKLDDKIISWGRKMENNPEEKTHYLLKYSMIVGAIVVYLSAVFVDLPIAGVLEDYYLTGPGEVKDFFLSWESQMSKGYEEYPPLFVSETSQEEVVAEMTQSARSEEEEKVVYIRLNERGSAGSNIRQTPSLNGIIVGDVKAETEIIYQGLWENDGERYWILVSVPNSDIEGWLSGRLVDGEQLAELIY